MINCEEIYCHAQKNLKTMVKHDEHREVGNNRTTMIGYDESKTITYGNETITLKQGSQTIEIYQDHSLTIKMGDCTTEVSMGNQATTVKMGDITMKANLGKISEEAMQEIELKVGANSLKIDQKGVTIKGLLVSIEADMQAELKSLMTTVNASAILTLKGSATMIN
jgi:type VI secretion system secreted protein VgrG